MRIAIFDDEEIQQLKKRGYLKCLIELRKLGK